MRQVPFAVKKWPTELTFELLDRMRECAREKFNSCATPRK
jgi:hypothetical protein